AYAALAAAAEGGAEVLCLCDTNGGTYPTNIAEEVARAVKSFPEIQIGVHCHNDTGMAVAQSMLAIDAGARQVQGTLIGYGER
ncbi:MAG: citramalate synthase, partial [Christensenella sp.]